MFRVGLGFDSHRLSAGRKLVLGGVEVASPVGEVAHSDGDVLLHALCDAIYGALCKGDIGEHFPDSDARWKGQASRVFLEHAAGLAVGEGYSLVNADLTILLEAPKLSPHKKRIAENVRQLLRPFWQLPEGSVSIKAKTSEGLDAVGRGEAISAQAVVLLSRD
jgi:2-C-methyl-D-erythritol 2,4-cyclodiphosphate synthase